MKTLLEWIEQKRSQFGNNFLLLVALVVFTLLALILAVVDALFVGLIYLSPYAVLVLTALLLILILYLNRPSNK